MWTRNQQQENNNPITSGYSSWKENTFHTNLPAPTFLLVSDCWCCPVAAGFKPSNWFSSPLGWLTVRMVPTIQELGKMFSCFYVYNTSSKYLFSRLWKYEIVGKSYAWYFQSLERVLIKIQSFFSVFAQSYLIFLIKLYQTYP